MNERHGSSTTPGPDLLARYLSACLHARQAREIVRPWGLGEEALDGLWSRLTEVLASDPERLNRIVTEELSAGERERIAGTLAPLIFALPLRSYPAELRAVKQGPRLIFKLRHLAGGCAAAGLPEKPAAAQGKEAAEKKGKARQHFEAVGYLPAALTEAFIAYLRGALKWPAGRMKLTAKVSSGGRRRHVRITLLARNRGVVVRFLERLPSPLEEA